MPPINWYLNRLQTMTIDEIVWRARDVGRDVIDRWRFAQHRYPTLSEDVGTAPPPYRLTHIQVGAWRQPVTGPAEIWRDRLLKYAGELMDHRLTFFNLEAASVGHPIDWNRDHETGKATPTGFAPTIDYRNAAAAGDAKVVWEPSRHQHFVPLARAYRATGDTRYAREVIAQIESWLDQSPFGYGMNWRSPLELGVRVINWVWALDLIHEAGLLTGPTGHRIRQAIYLHVWEIARKFSRGSSSNNHVIGEAAGVFVATSYFPDLPRHRELHIEARAILLRELLAQTHEDGGSREQAPGYQVFVLQFYLAAAVVARKQGADFPREHWARIEKMLEFLAALTEGGSLPLFGDGDDGYVLDLGARGNPASVLSAGAILCDRPDFASGLGDETEWAFWLLGTAPAHASRPVVLVSRSYHHTGYYLLQSGVAGSDDSASLVFDCAELGFGPLAAHGHADALSFVFRLGGIDVLADPGTYDYFTYPEWRRYLRGTPAHNTVTVDSVDQSVITGPFMWGTRAKATLLEWRPSSTGGIVVGEHDGYTRLDDPVTHRRRVELDTQARMLTITDYIEARGNHDIQIVFQFSEHCRVADSDGTFHVTIGRHQLVVRTDPAATAAIAPRSDRPESGWVSRGYHRRREAPRLVARAQTTGQATFTTVMHY
jgi:heparinase II/III-like protein